MRHLWVDEWIFWALHDTNSDLYKHVEETSSPNDRLLSKDKQYVVWQMYNLSNDRFVSVGTQFPYLAFSFKQNSEPLTRQMPSLIWILSWVHRSFCWFCHAQSHLSLTSLGVWRNEPMLIWGKLASVKKWIVFFWHSLKYERNIFYLGPVQKVTWRPKTSGKWNY